MHEIFLGWAEQALDATNTIPADDDLGKAVMVTDRHDWNLGSTACPRRSHQQQHPAPSWKTIWCRLGARCTVATDERSPNLGIFLVKLIGDAGLVAIAGRTMERWSRLTCRTIFDRPHVSLIEPPQSRVSIDRNHARTPEMSADVTCSKAEIESNEVQSVS